MNKVFLVLVMMFLASRAYCEDVEQAPPQSVGGQAAPAATPVVVENEDTAEENKAAAGIAPVENIPPVVTVKKVTAVEVKGNKAIAQTVILSKVKIRVGLEYSTNIISDDIKRLNETGFFSDISVDTQDFGGGLKVIIMVTEKPILEKIKFSGYFSRIMREERLKETMKSKEGQYLDPVILKEDINSIKDTFVKKGYSQVTVEDTIETKSDTNKAVLVLKIDSGIRVKIRKLDIQGNKNFKKARLLKVIKTRRAGIFSSGFYKEDLLKDDIERLRSFYHKAGFTDVKVDYETGMEVKKGLMFVTIRIDEGKKYLVGEVFIKENTVFNETEIKKSLKVISPGKVFSSEGMREDIANIQSIYFDKGYIFTQVNESSYLNPETGKVDITYALDEGVVAYVDKVRIRGNIKTKDVVIRRELRIYPGDRFDGSKLKRSKERLQNLGFFEEVSYDIEESGHTEPNKRDLVVDVKESKTGEFSFGGGYSTVDKLIGFVEVAQKNFDWKNFPYFTGAGQDLRFRAELGSISRNMELSFTEPWMWNYPISFGFDGYRRVRDREGDVGYGYSEKRTGGDLRLGKEVNEYLRADTMYRLEEVDISNVSSSASQGLIDERGKNVISSLQFGLSQDTRDNVFTPTKGYILAGNLEVAGGPLMGDKDWIKLTNRASKYFSLINSSVLEFKLSSGLANAYSNSNKVPIYERFYAGGAYTVRGYHERIIGPYDATSKDPIGGEAMLVGNIEYLYPLVNPVKGAVFYDVGNVWDKVSKFGSSGYKAGFGFGVRLKTPIGPIKLDYGWPLNKEQNETAKGKGRLHFSLSHNF